MCGDVGLTTEAPVPVPCDLGWQECGGHQFLGKYCSLQPQPYIKRLSPAQVK